MNTTIAQERQVRELKENLQDAVALARKFKREMGVIDQEELARLSSKANGTPFRASDFNMDDVNGEQGR